MLKDRYNILGGKTLAWLIIANVGVSLVLWLSLPAERLLGVDITSSLLSCLELSSRPLTVLTHPWTLLTYMVTQSAPLHLLVNMLWLWMFGRIFMMLSGSRRLLTAYIGGGLCGALFYIIMYAVGISGIAGRHLAGSSAAVMAVMAAAAVTAPNLPLRFMLIGEVRLKWVAIVAIALTLIGSSAGIATQGAHVGGIVFGVLIALKWRHGIKMPKITMPKLPRLKPRKRVTEEDRDTVISALKGRLCDHERLDELLDKIRVSGYDSLSDSEKRELDAISRRL